MKVLVVGDVMLDRYIYGRATRVSPEAPTLVVEVDNHKRALGGAGNVAANLAALGVDTTLVGVIGDNEAGEQVTKLVSELNISSRLVIDPTRPTTVKTRVMAGQQQVLRLDQEQATTLREETHEELLSYLDTPCDFIVIQDYDKGVLSNKTIPILMSRGIPVIVDPKKKNFESYAGALVFKPNRREVLDHCHVMSFMSRDEMHVYRKTLGVKHLLVTLGDRGLVLVSEDVDDLLYLPAHAKEVYDVTGAGDTLLATLAWGLCQGFTMTRAAWAANLAASLQVTKRGTSVVTLAELTALIKENDAWPSASLT